MCDPVTAAVTVAIIGSTATAYGTYEESKAGAKAAEAQAEQEEATADVLDLQKLDALKRGGQAERRERASLESLLGSQKAAFAASGVEVGEGTAAQVAASTEDIGEQDIRTVHESAVKEAWGFTEQAKAARISAASLRKRARKARKLAPIRATTSLLTSASSTALTAGVL